jgi:hypothetical protein
MVGFCALRSAGAAAALVLCFSVALAAVAIAPPIDAKPDMQPVLAKADRSPLPAKGSACSEHSWPHYEQHCLFDRSRLRQEARDVRVIAAR